MSSGVPVVTTSLGADGLFWDQFVGNRLEKLFRNALAVADGAEAYAQLIVDVYTKPALFEKYVQGGLEMAAFQLTGDQFKEDTQRILQHVDKLPVNNRRPTFHFVPAAKNLRIHTHPGEW